MILKPASDDPGALFQRLVKEPGKGYFPIEIKIALNIH